MTLYVGAHVSVSSSKVSSDPETPPYGNVTNAVYRQVQFGGNCGQIFSGSPQTWSKSSFTTEEATEFQTETNEQLDAPWVIHASYLVNLCTPKDGLRAKSIDSMQHEVNVASQLGIPYVNVHLGAHTGAGVDQGLTNAVSALDELTIPDEVTVLIESDAGSGTKLGDEFEHLARVLEESRHDLGVCLDTAHMFAAGYNLRTADAVDKTLEEFDDVVGEDSLHYIHLNDSKHRCGTNKDEHAHIGEGLIGEAGMQAFINHPIVQGVPIALETPTEDGKGFAWNIQKTRDLYSNA